MRTQRGNQHDNWGDIHARSFVLSPRYNSLCSISHSRSPYWRQRLRNTFSKLTGTLSLFRAGVLIRFDLEARFELDATIIARRLPNYPSGSASYKTRSYG
jgi:hypothetical protein